MAALVLPSVPWEEPAPPPNDSPSLSGDRALPSPFHCVPLSASKYFLHALVSRPSGDHFRISFQPLRPSEHISSGPFMWQLRALSHGVGQGLAWGHRGFQ